MNINDFDNVIIYQFGKVASSTLKKSFEKHIRTSQVHHFHDSMIRQGKVLIINIVRNLFDRNISALFENIYSKPRNYFIMPGYINEGSLLRTNKTELDDIMDFFREVNIEKLLKIIYKNWYTRFNEQLNINIFADPFDKEKKYNLYKVDNVTVLILRFEDINEWENIFNNIFTTKITLENSNLTKHKKINELYESFKKNYKYSENEINLIKNIDFMKKFYTENEINSFINKYNKSND